MIKGINLIPEEIRQEWVWRKWMLCMKVAAVVYLCALGLFYMNQRALIKERAGELRSLLKQRERLLAQNAGYVELKARFGDIQKAEGDMKKRLGLAASLEEKRIAWSDILRRVSSGAPEGVWLKSLSTSDDGPVKKVRFVGSATTNRAVPDFIFQLENNGIFQNVEFLYSQKREFDKTVVYDFEVTAVLRKI